MVIPINNYPTIWWNSVTIILWGICAIWLIAMLIYRGQRISIRVLPFEVQPRAKGELTIKLKGFIDARHPEGLESLEFWVNPLLEVKPAGDSKIPHSVDSKPRWFDVSYNVTTNFLNDAMRDQSISTSDIAWILSANVGDYIWLWYGHTIPWGLIKNGGIIAMASKPKTKRARRKRNAQKQEEGQLGISKKQFDELIAKASQHIKKFEKGKS